MAMTQNKDNISITFPNITYYTTSLIFLCIYRIL